jgi:excisionase family DNA binding protein
MTEQAKALVADGLCSIEEARRFLGVSRSKIYELMEAGDLEYAKIGRNRKIPWAAVKALAARSLVGVI